MNYNDFNGKLNANDYFRTNLWTIAFSGGPGNRIVNSFDKMVSPVLDSTNGLVGGLLDMTYNYGKNLATGKINSWANSNDGRKVVGLLQSKVVMSLMGEFNAGLACMDMFSSLDIVQYSAESVALPDLDLSHQYGRTPLGSVHKFGKRNPGYFTVTFRQPPGGSMLGAWVDYIDTITNQKTNGRLYPEDIECSVTLTQFTRNGSPETVHQFNGVLPVSCTLPEFSYEDNNELVKFTVRFAYKEYYPGLVGEPARKDFLESAAGLVAGYAGSVVAPAVNEITGAIGNSTSAALERMGGALQTGISKSLGDLFRF